MNAKFIEREINYVNNPKIVKSRSREKKIDFPANKSITTNNNAAINNRKNNNTMDNLFKEEIDRLENINKLESAIIELRIQKIIFRKNFRRMLMNILSKKKDKINLVKIYSFLLKNKYNEFLISLKSKIYAKSLKKISYTYLYSVSIRNVYDKLKKHNNIKKNRRSLSYFEQKLFYANIIKSFNFNFQLNINNNQNKNDKIKNLILKRIRSYIEKIFELKNQLENYSEISTKFNTYVNNPYNFDCDRNYFEQEIKMLNYSELVREHKNFKKSKNLFMKKLIFENLLINKNRNLSCLQILEEKHNKNLIFNCLKIVKLALYRKHQISDYTSEYKLQKKQNILTSTFKKFIKNKKIKKRNLDFLISQIRFKKKAAIKYWFLFTLRISHTKSQLNQKLENSKLKFFNVFVLNKLKKLLINAKDLKNQLEILKQGKMRRAVNILLKNHKYRNEFKAKVKTLFGKIEKAFMRKAMKKIIIFPSILKEIIIRNKKNFFKKILFLNMRKLLLLKSIMNHLALLKRNSSLVDLKKKIYFNILSTNTKLKLRQSKNKSLAYFFHKRKSKLKIFKKLRSIFDILKKQKKIYIVALLNFRNNYIKKAFSGFKINLMISKQKNKIYQNLLRERSNFIKSNLFNRILCRVLTSIALSKDAFQNRYFEIIKKLKNEKYNFDNYVTGEEYNYFNKIDEKANLHDKNIISINNFNKIEDFSKPRDFSRKDCDFNSHNNNQILNVRNQENSKIHYFKKNNFSNQNNNTQKIYNNQRIYSTKENMDYDNYNKIDLHQSFGKTIPEIQDKDQIKNLNNFNNINSLNYQELKSNNLFETTAILRKNNLNLLNEETTKKTEIIYDDLLFNKLETKLLNLENVDKKSLLNHKTSKINDDIKILMEMRNRKKAEPILNFHN